MAKKIINLKSDGTPSTRFQGYLQKIFAQMFMAVGITALTTYATLQWGLNLIFSIHDGGSVGLSPLFWIVTFGGLGVALFAQYKAFSLKPMTARILLGIYAISIGFVTAPMIAMVLNMDPTIVFKAFVLAALMFGCMALFGYKTQKDLSFLGVFLFMGMIGLIIAGIVSFFWVSDMYVTIVSAIGVLIFALFTAYDMQYLKNAYTHLDLEKNDELREQMAVAGALHLYISFVALFRYILTLLSQRN